MPKTHAAQRRAPRRRRAHGRLRRLGHAASTTARRSTSTTRCARDAGMFDVSHMRVVDLAGRRRARVPALRARQQRRQAEGARQGALLVPAARRRRRARRPHRLLPARGLLPRSSSMRRPRTRTSRGCAQLARAARAAARDHAARRPRDDRRAGPARAREGLAGAARTARRRPRDLKPFNARRRADAPSASCSSRAPATPARTASRSWCRRARAEALWQALAARRRAPVRARRARHAAPRGRHEPLRPGHGRDGVAARVGPRLDRRPRERARLRRQGRAARAAARRATARRPAAAVDAGGVLRAHQVVRTRARRRRDHERHVLAHARQSIALARVPAGVAVGDVVHVAVRDKRSPARVVKPPFVRNGKVLVELIARAHRPQLTRKEHAMNVPTDLQVHRQPRMGAPRRRRHA